MKHNSNFAYDLEIGQEGEQKIAMILGSPVEKIEVKRDLKANRTGNLYFEYESRGKKSGIATTEADYIFIIVENSVGGLFFETKKLREVLRPLIPTHTKLGGDSNTSKGILIKISELMKLYCSN
jgi:hypothetical protein